MLPCHDPTGILAPVCGMEIYVGEPCSVVPSSSRPSTVVPDSKPVLRLASSVSLDLPVPADGLTSDQEDGHDNGSDYDYFTQLLHVSSS